MSEYTTPLPEEIRRHIVESIASVQFGSVAITVHDARVVQVEKSEKRRFDS